MPDTTQRHRDQQVHVRSRGPLPISAQWDVQIVPQPAAEAYVPAPPEVAHRRGPIWSIEVPHQIEAQQTSYSLGDAAIAAKVAVDLDREGNRPEDHRRALLLVHIERRVDERC